MIDGATLEAGWIPHIGNAIPADLDPKAEVQILCWNGVINTMLAENVLWDQGEEYWVVTAYRLTETAPIPTYADGIADAAKVCEAYGSDIDPQVGDYLAQRIRELAPKEPDHAKEEQR